MRDANEDGTARALRAVRAARSAISTNAVAQAAELSRSRAQEVLRLLERKGLIARASVGGRTKRLAFWRPLHEPKRSESITVRGSVRGLVVDIEASGDGAAKLIESALGLAAALMGGDQ